MLVKTYQHGYKKIKLIGKNLMLNNPNNFENCMYVFKNSKDLMVTGGHSILVDDLGKYTEKNTKIFNGTQKIDDKYLLLAAVSDDFFKINDNKIYETYHLVLDNDADDETKYGIWANDILTETTSKTNFINKKFTVL